MFKKGWNKGRTILDFEAVRYFREETYDISSWSARINKELVGFRVVTRNPHTQVQINPPEEGSFNLTIHSLALEAETGIAAKTFEDGFKLLLSGA